MGKDSPSKEKRQAASDDDHPGGITMNADFRSVLFHVGQQLKAEAHLLSEG
jgi:hypothetical protein